MDEQRQKLFFGFNRGRTKARSFATMAVNCILERNTNFSDGNDRDSAEGA